VKTMNRSIIYVINREEIERCDVARFLACFKLNHRKKPSCPMGKVVICVSGYDCTAEEFHLIGAVRKYFAKIHRQWPCWLYFLNLESNCLRVVACCTRKILSSDQVLSGSTARALFDLDWVTRFIGDGLDPLAQLMEAAGMDEGKFDKRVWEILRYFGLPRHPYKRPE